LPISRALLGGTIDEHLAIFQISALGRICEPQQKAKSALGGPEKSLNYQVTIRKLVDVLLNLDILDDRRGQVFDEASRIFSW